ncbi:dCTP deaminase domain-containing protein [Actinomycetospora callitridis]|uniref:dCTP deaminase domain-containing protein n=1 Tax=Actinomycetospora callitridis TaxID=913944 RepID=UPI0023653E4C|nr:hypothetical protein [Actinomycetospora callitridis]MDD7917989.1 hypothetical protein [Actinomycetospora callitridis]
MLSDNQIRNLVESKELEVTYSFLPNSTRSFERRDPAASVGDDPAARLFFDQSLIRSRLALTLGPIIRPVSQWRRASRNRRFAGHTSLVDLRQCPDGWALAPSQSVVVFTNEYLATPSNVVGLIVGRVSSYNNGLVTATSYVDSTWRGLAKLHLINTSQRTVRLKLGMEIGRAFFFATPDATTIDNTVQQQGVHFGITWGRILDDEIDPFPLSSAPRPESRLARVKALNEAATQYAGYGLIALLVLAIGGGVKLYADVSQAVASSDRLARLEQSERDRLAGAPRTGVASIVVQPGQNEGSATIVLPPGTQFREGSTYSGSSLVTPSPGVVAAATARSSNSDVVLTVMVRLATPARESTTIPVQWIFVS